jgi:hypothetical protein
MVVLSDWSVVRCLASLTKLALEYSQPYRAYCSTDRLYVTVKHIRRPHRYPKPQSVPVLRTAARTVRFAGSQQAVRSWARRRTHRTCGRLWKEQRGQTWGPSEHKKHTTKRGSSEARHEARHEARQVPHPKGSAVVLASLVVSRVSWLRVSWLRVSWLRVSRVSWLRVSRVSLRSTLALLGPKSRAHEATTAQFLHQKVREGNKETSTTWLALSTSD